MDLSVGTKEQLELHKILDQVVKYTKGEGGRQHCLQLMSCDSIASLTEYSVTTKDI